MIQIRWEQNWLCFIYWTFSLHFDTLSVVFSTFWWIFGVSFDIYSSEYIRSICRLIVIWRGFFVDKWQLNDNYMLINNTLSDQMVCHETNSFIHSLTAVSAPDYVPITIGSFNVKTRRIWLLENHTSPYSTCITQPHTTHTHSELKYLRRK